MAYFNPKTGNIELSEDDKKMFGEIKASFQPTGGMKHPIANSIIKAILPDYLKKDENNSNQR